MAYSNGKLIVTDGLVLALDSAVKRSYPGTGTTWYDLSGNDNHCYMQGYTSNPVFQNGGFFFNGNTSKSYFESTTNNNLTGIDNATVMMWVKPTAITQRHYALDTRVTSNPPGVGVGFDSDNTAMHFVQTAGGYDEAAGPTFTSLVDNYWHIGIVRTTTSIEVIGTDNKTLEAPALTAAGITLDNGTINLGKYRVGSWENTNGSTENYWWTGYIYTLLGYNRALTAEEVVQNYNATKGRFI